MRTTLILAILLASAPAIAEQSTVEGAANAYQLETTWRAENGKRVALSQFKGQPVLLAFVYTSCSATCPLTTRNLVKLEASLGASPTIVVVSLDPEHDTAAAVREYRKRYQLEKKSSWHVLVGDDAELRKLTMLLDFRFSKNAESGAIMHDNKVFVLDANGLVRRVGQSLGEDHDALVAAYQQVNAKTH